MADILSVPTTITFLYLPDSTNIAAVCKVYINPEQAALISNPKAFFIPTRSEIIFEFAVGNFPEGS